MYVRFFEGVVRGLNPSLVYEKKVDSLGALRRELQVLDGDAGARVRGSYGGRRCFAFVTRFGETFTVVVCAAKGQGGRTPGRMLESKEFTDIETTMRFLTPIATTPFNAFVY